jgi:Tol biopolymer transport system component
VVALTRPVQPASTTNILMTLGLAAAVGLAGLLWMGVRAATTAALHLPPNVGPAGNGLLLYEAGGALFVRPSIGGAPRQLLAGTDPSEHLSPVWSPDGQRFAITLRGEGSYGMATVAADGTGIVALPASDPTDVAWSPDSRMLAVIEAAPSSSLDIISALGTTTYDLVFHGTVLGVAWQPPDGQLLLVEAESSTGERDLYLADPFGSSTRALGLTTRLPRQSDGTGGAIFSPDGKTIAFAVDAGGPSSTGPMVRTSLFGLDGAGIRELPGSPTEATSETPVAFSPDGKWLLIRRAAPGGCCPSFRTEAWLAIIPADGSGPARDIGPHLPEIDATVDAAFSPDGTRILTGAETDTPTVYSIDPITGNAQTLDWTESVPSWQRVAP